MEARRAETLAAPCEARQRGPARHRPEQVMTLSQARLKRAEGANKFCGRSGSTSDRRHSAADRTGSTERTSAIDVAAREDSLAGSTPAPAARTRLKRALVRLIIAKMRREA